MVWRRPRLIGLKGIMHSYILIPYIQSEWYFSGTQLEYTKWASEPLKIRCLLTISANGTPCWTMVIKCILFFIVRMKKGISTFTYLHSKKPQVVKHHRNINNFNNLLMNKQQREMKYNDDEEGTHNCYGQNIYLIWTRRCHQPTNEF